MTRFVHRLGRGNTGLSQSYAPREIDIQVTLFVTPALPKIHVPSQVQILQLEPAKSLMWLKVILTPFPRF
jgi:hypothetical protein